MKIQIIDENGQEQTKIWKLESGLVKRLIDFFREGMNTLSFE